VAAANATVRQRRRLSARCAATSKVPNGRAPGESVVVELDYEYEYITPVRRIVNFLSGGNIDETLTISAKTDMRLE
jgi:hypothetical protein